MLEAGQAENRRRKRNALLKVLLQAATMTFLAEWGDRSQLATVVLATREDAFGVVMGGSLGHALCTGLAVVGGRMIAQKISVRTGEWHEYTSPCTVCGSLCPRFAVNDLPTRRDVECASFKGDSNDHVLLLTEYSIISWTGIKTYNDLSIMLPLKTNDTDHYSHKTVA
ncbi:Transmembrane protein 165 [Eumeta japonica]|uniref:GDT1 family protein n=1 Tax=Eumeta variegata TaxID=151549 RepID=A0A4C1V892_EUMVA|nr:Transmembrane protein 165 [Eumeta japonica]